MNDENFLKTLFGGLSSQANTGMGNAASNSYSGLGLIPIGMQLLQGGMSIYSGLKAQSMAEQNNNMNRMLVRNNALANLESSIARAEITERKRKDARGSSYKPDYKFIKALNELKGKL